MILRELFYFDRISTESGEQKEYDPTSDQSVMGISDTRKTRLTLKHLNKLRKVREMRKADQEKNKEFVATMYAQPPAV